MKQFISAIKPIIQVSVFAMLSSCAGYMNYLDYFPYENKSNKTRAEFVVHNYTVRDFSLIGIIFPIFPISISEAKVDHLLVDVDNGVCPTLYLNERKLKPEWKKRTIRYTGVEWVPYNCDYGSLPTPILDSYIFEYNNEMYSFKFEKVYSSGYSPLVDL